ncbi:anticodon-binding protein [Suillus ampliporus]|nr:anticodon-binding protein [Suillus ampliporus]
MQNDSEYSRAGIQDPQNTVTASRDLSSELLQFAKETRLLFPNWHRINRGNYVINKSMNAMIVSHFPHGPTVYFTLHNVSLRDDIGSYKSSTVPRSSTHTSSSKSSLLSSVFGHEILKSLFPVPKEDSKRVVMFSNGRLHFLSATVGLRFELKRERDCISFLVANFTLEILAADRGKTMGIDTLFAAKKRSLLSGLAAHSAADLDRTSSKRTNR